MYVQRNSEALSRNHCCRGRKVTIPYSQFVYVALVTQHSMRRITLSYVACLVVLYFFFKLSHERHNFRERVTEHKMCVLILSTTFVWNIFYSKKNWARYDQNFIFVHVKHPLFLSDFYKNLISSTDFRKILKYRMLEKAGTVGAELFRACVRTDRQK